MDMASRIRRWRMPEECIALVRLDRAGWTTLVVAMAVSGVILALMLNAISG